MEGKNLPAVSVIIPVRNEEARIGLCLQCVVNQDYPKKLIEILVVDGMSEDSSCEVVRQFIKRYPAIKLIQNPQMATTYALNKGIMASRGDVIIRVDAHSCIEPDYINRCVKALYETGAQNVGGLMRPVGRSLMENAIALAMCSPFGVGGGKFHYCEKEMFVDTVYLGAYRREVFEKIGLYDEGAHYSEDDELNYRLIKSGGKILLSPTIKSRYFPRSSLSTLWKQYYNYGRGKARTVKKHGRPAAWRHVVPSILVLSIFGCLALYFVSPLFGWLCIGISGSYLISAFFVAAKISLRKGWKYFRLLPTIFATLHFAYGIGFLWGILRVYVLDAVRPEKEPT